MAVSSLVPAAAGITVADGLAAGWGSNAWTQIASVSQTTAVTYTVSGLSGYRKIKIGVLGFMTDTTGGGVITFRFNADTNTNYTWEVNLQQNGPALRQGRARNDDKLLVSGIGNSNQMAVGIYEIDNPVSAFKIITGRTNTSSEDYFGSANSGASDVNGVWRNNSSAISSVTFQMPTSISNTNGLFVVWGQL
jgi:hypothetical protein